MAKCVKQLLHTQDDGDGLEALQVLARAFESFQWLQKSPGSTKKSELRSIESLSLLSHSELFVGSDPYALAGTKGCAVFSLR